MRTIFGTTSSDCSRRWRWSASCQPPRDSESNSYDRSLQTGRRRKWSIWDVLGCLLCCRIFSVLSAILYLGNVTYSQKSSGREEGLDVGPPEVLSTLSDLLKVNALPKLTTRDVILTYLCRLMFSDLKKLNASLKISLFSNAFKIYVFNAWVPSQICNDEIRQN